MTPARALVRWTSSTGRTRETWYQLAGAAADLHASDGAGYCWIEPGWPDDFGTPAPVLEADALYLGDNGRCYCGQHSGATAQATGRDLSGQRVLELTPELARIAAGQGWTPKCEECGKEAKS